MSSRNLERVNPEGRLPALGPSAQSGAGPLPREMLRMISRQSLSTERSPHTCPLKGDTMPPFPR